MTFKKVISFLMVPVMLVVISACGSSNTPDNNEGSKGSAGEDNVVRILNSVLATPELEAAWAEVLSDFEQETGLKVEARYQGKWDEYPRILNSAKMAGEPVDVGVTGVGLVQSPLGPGGMVMDLTDLAAGLVDRYEDGILDSSIMGDKLWLLPLADGGSTTMVYNVRMFEELGLKVPTTFDELVEVSKVIKDQKGITPMLINGKDAWTWPMMYFATYAQETGNQSVANVESFLTGEKKFTGEMEEKAFDDIKQLFDAGVMATDSFDTNSDGMIASFSQEKVAMLFLLDNYIPYIQSANPDIEIGIMKFPVMKAGAKSEHAFGVGDGGLFIPSFIDDSRLDNAMRLVEFLTRPENAGKIINANGPTKFKIFKDVEAGDSELIKQLNELILPDSSLYLDWIWPAEVNDAFTQAIPAVNYGAMTAAEATQLVQDAYDTLVREKDYVYDWWNSFTDEQLEDITPSHIPDLSNFMK